MNNNRKIEYKNELLEKAINAFKQETHFVLEQGVFYENTGDNYADAKLNLHIKKNIYNFLVEIKPTLNETNIGKMAHQVADTKVKWLLVTHYIPAHFAKKMKALGIQFIDTVGNAFIDEPPLYIFTYGNKPAKTEIERGEKIGLGQAGVRIVFALLCKKELVNATYRELAQTANVALGTVAGVFKDLLRQGFIIDMGARGKMLVKKKELFDRWITAYAEKLRHKNLIGKYATNNIEAWGEQNITKYHAQFGGETAAQRITGYLKPEIVTIYTTRPINNLVAALKLYKNEEGNIELRERFWNFDMPEANNLVPPILTYADLLATTNTRNIETAKMIYDDIIQRYIGQD